MMARTLKAALFGIFVSSLLGSACFATTTVTASVVPSIIAPGGTVFLHTAVANFNATPGPVTVTVKVTNPGTCASGSVIPSNVGAFAFALRATETRLATLSLDVPPTACSGTYTVTVTVHNTITGATLTKNTSFTVQIGAP